MSYRDETVAIISMAQQARPNVIGNNADFRDQFTSASKLVVRIFASNCRSRKLICVFPLLLQIEGDCQECPSLRALSQSSHLTFKGSLVDPRLRASNEHIPIVRVPRAGERPGCPSHPSESACSASTKGIPTIPPLNPIRVPPSSRHTRIRPAG